MKALATGFLIYLLAVACQSDKIGPTEGLYKTWESQSSATNQTRLLSFRRDGSLRYDATRQEAGCCDPVRFEQADNQLTFINDYGRAGCQFVYCAPSLLTAASPWTIETLDADELILSSNGQRITFKSR